MVNYSNSVVYKIICLDPKINDIYVGSTCSFRARKFHHKSNCNNENCNEYNRYVYRYIRDNGGFNNWSMVIIKAYPKIKNKLELTAKEMKWMAKLNATLNCKRVYNGIAGNLSTPISAEHSKRYNKKHNKEYFKQYYIDNKNHISEKIKCECGCMTRRDHLSRHIRTAKHIKLMAEK